MIFQHSCFSPVAKLPYEGIETPRLGQYPQVVSVAKLPYEGIETSTSLLKLFASKASRNFLMKGLKPLLAQDGGDKRKKSRNFLMKGLKQRRQAETSRIAAVAKLPYEGIETSHHCYDLLIFGAVAKLPYEGIETSPSW